jgi:hypothetical protein
MLHTPTCCCLCPSSLPPPGTLCPLHSTPALSPKVEKKREIGRVVEKKGDLEVEMVERYIDT